MSTERIEPRFSDDGAGDNDEFVAYSPVSSHTAIAPVDPAPVGRKRRSGAMRLFYTTAIFAIVAGIGILVVSVANVAFVASDQPAPGEANFSEPIQAVTGEESAPEIIGADTAPEMASSDSDTAPDVAGSDTAPDVAFTGGVRRISLPESQDATPTGDPTSVDANPSSGREDIPAIPSEEPAGVAAVPPADVIPPLPRPRPEVASFVTNPSPPAITNPPPPVIASPPPPVAGAPNTPGLAEPGFNLLSPVETTAGGIQPAPSGADNLLLDIEETLAEIDAGTGPSAPSANAPAPVLPPAPVLEPPLATAPTQLPAASAGLPPFEGGGAPFDVLPPLVNDGGSPAGGFGNEGVLLGPIPPEPIPYTSFSNES